MKWISFSSLMLLVALRMNPAMAQEIKTVKFGVNTPLKIVSSRGISAEALASRIFENYTNILASNAPLNRYITPNDIVVLCPPVSLAVLNGKKTVPSSLSNAHALLLEKDLSANGTYIIYITGHRFITIDPQMAKANGYSSSAVLATRLARHYMQNFPRECFRPPTLPPLIDIPENPPLRLTTNLEDCVPQDVRGRVYIFGKGLFNLAAVQQDGKTGPDKAAEWTSLANRVLGNISDHRPEDIKLEEKGAMAVVKVGDEVLYLLTDFDASANGFTSASGLAQYVVTSIRNRIESGIL